MFQGSSNKHLFATILTLACLCSTENTFAQAPGGVTTSLVLWLKADAGTGTTMDASLVTTWTDQVASFAFTSTPTNGGTNDPTYIANSINYNPSVLYTSSAMHAIPAFTGPSLLNSTVYVAGKPITKAADGYNAIWTTYTDVAGDRIWAPYLGNNVLEVYDIPIAESFSNLTWGADEVSFIRQRVSGANVIYAKQGSSEEILPNALSTFATSGNSNFQTLGNNPDPTGNEPFGNISETFIYQTSSLSAGDIQKIESYIALKYGITLDNSAGGTAGNYVLSTGAIAWAANVNPLYHHNVIGIVRDDASALVQKQSKQTDDVTRIYLSTLGTINSENTGAFSSTNQAIVIGNNDGELVSKGSTEYPSGLGIFGRMEREWKITNTNFNGTFSLDINFGTTPIWADNLRILIDDDGDFTNATMYSPTISYSGGVVTISGLSNSQIPTNTTRYLTIVSLDNPLPVTLVQFTVQATENKKVQVNWQTELELNNAYFTVERSINGISWETVATISGEGNSFVLKTYQILDEKPYVGISYYRLKQTDFTGEYKYSKIVSVRIDKSMSSQVFVYPNPTTNLVIVEGDSTELKTIRVFNILGQEIRDIITNTDATNERALLDLNHLVPGVYTIKTATTAHKVIKE